MDELPRKGEQQRLVRDFLDFIFPKLREPSLRLRIAQPLAPTLQAGKGVGDREAVNLHSPMVVQVCSPAERILGVEGLKAFLA